MIVKAKYWFRSIQNFKVDAFTYLRLRQFSSITEIGDYLMIHYNAGQWKDIYAMQRDTSVILGADWN